MANLIVWQHLSGNVGFTRPPIEYESLPWADGPILFSLDDAVPLSEHVGQIRTTAYLFSEAEYLDLMAQVTWEKHKHETLADYTRLPNMPLDVVFAMPRRWRQAFRITAGAIHIDVAAARARRLEEIGWEYAGLLAAAKEKQLELDDIGTPQEIAAHKLYRQRLRTMPATTPADLDAIITLEGLEQYQPAWPIRP